MTGSWEEAEMFARWRFAIRRPVHGQFCYIRVHPEVDPLDPPATLPGEQGEAVTRWTPTYEDKQATDWELY